MQVVKRTFELLEILRGNDGMELKDIAEALKLRNNTTWNLLATLVEIGYVKKTSYGKYALGDECMRFFWDSFMDYSKIIFPYIETLCRDIKETVVAVNLSGSILNVITKTDYLDDFCVSSKIYNQPDALYRWACGRLVFAWQPVSIVNYIAAKHGLPQGTEWDGVYTLEALHEKLKQIREQNSTKRITKFKDGNGLFAFAAPVFDSEKKFRLALGVTYPSSRESEIHRQCIIEHLAVTAEKISKIL